MPTDADRTVAAALRTRGPSSIDDLARDEDLERDEVKRGIHRLISAGRLDVAPAPETGAALYALRERLPYRDSAPLKNGNAAMEY